MARLRASNSTAPVCERHSITRANSLCTVTSSNHCAATDEDSCRLLVAGSNSARRTRSPRRRSKIERNKREMAKHRSRRSAMPAEQPGDFPRQIAPVAGCPLLERSTASIARSAPSRFRRVRSAALVGRAVSRQERSPKRRTRDGSANRCLGPANKGCAMAMFYSWVRLRGSRSRSAENNGRAEPSPRSRL